MSVLDLVGKIFRKFFGSRNDRLLKRYRSYALAAGEFEQELRGHYDQRFAEESVKIPKDLPDEDTEFARQKVRVEQSQDLRDRTDSLRQRLTEGEPAESVLPEAFAVLREASRRAQNHRHFDCQLVGGQVLFEGKIAEMKTGEGKTIVCHLAAYLKCLQGKKVHIVTVNDYLVQRDANFAKPIFELVGLTVGYIQSQVDPGGSQGIRQKAYACNITYGTNNEFGFDYLRDNMKMSLEDQAQGRLDFAIIDEVDSILIDEARTPLIISGPASDDVNRYRIANTVAKVLITRQSTANSDTAARIREWGDKIPEHLTKHPKFEPAIKRFKTDPFWLTEDESEALEHRQFYIVAKERKSVHLTHEGVTVAQEQLGVGSLYVGANMEWPHLLENSVRAHAVYEKDVDYVVKDGEVIIVDSFTGRLMVGRQWSDGLHQAVEAKENVKVKEETQTLATITLQNFFKLYDKIAGMTGTAMTEADEFMKIYKLDVVAIPTNRPINRMDFNDRIYKTVEEKYQAIVEEIHDVHTKGRPSDPYAIGAALPHLRSILTKQGRPVDKIDQSLGDWNNMEKPPSEKEGEKAMAKWQSRQDEVIQQIAEAYDDAMGDLIRGRPVLVGTVSVENSEKLSSMLTKRHGIEHEVLNAKQHAREAEIVKKAGYWHESERGKSKQALGNVTIATNMAGRGTDIKLQEGVVHLKCIGDLGPPDNGDGRHYYWNEKGVIGTKCCINCPDYDPKTNCAHCWKPKIDPRFPELGRKVCPATTPCGLHIVGTERHESRRIDNQLRGRSGRQGDPGSSRFFLSLRDDLLRMFMGDWMLKMLEKSYNPGEAIEHRSVSKGIERAQKKVEERNFSARKHLLEYDEVMDSQRQVFYTQRQEILAAGRPGRSEHLVTVIWQMIDDTIDTAAGKYLNPDYSAQCIRDWVRAEMECNVEPKSLDMSDFTSMARFIRESAKDEARGQIAITVGEYMDEDLDPKEWDIRGLARWAETRFNMQVSQNQLRTLSQREVQEQLVEAAETKIDSRDFAALEVFLDADIGKKSLILWARQKFGLEFTPDEFLNLTNDETTALLREKIREAYREREVTYPVEWIINRAFGGGQADNAYSLDALSQWANFKFRVGWTVDSVRNRKPEELAEELVNLNRAHMRNGKLDAEIEEAVALGKDLAKWGQERFGPAFDGELFSASENPRETLVMFGRDLLRRELTVLERFVLLQIYDQSWKEHMHAIDLLKEAIGLRGFAEQDPKIAYKREGFKMFQEMMNGIYDKVTGIIFRARLMDDGETRSRYRIGAATHADATNQGFAAQAAQDQAAAMEAQNVEKKIETIRREQPKVGRNDPCPCGSGKKYKQCCGKTQ